MEETIEYWENKRTEFVDALENEREPELLNDNMMRLLKMEINHCDEEIKLLKNV